MGRVDTAYVSAFSALAGALIGGLASFGSSWVTQRTQQRFTDRQANRTKRETLYAEFVAEAAQRYGDALGHQKDDVADLVKLYALIGRLRLVASRPVVTAAEQTLDVIIETYLGPNRTLHEVVGDAKQGRMQFLVGFGEACREDLAHGGTIGE